ncbi:hypothetical protein RBE51_21350 [Pseudomonas taiwanensis]|uniref:hypothetical protein n=1 Tax=Pseudomonas taiwanensis TaxID=470150 RepID=UPI0028DF1C13|nr:hypothetical protein [Pseudomonas taiwanensis]MDT8925345.1 hypothetical protein [Pseudomonas taiwanensis]
MSTSNPASPIQATPDFVDRFINMDTGFAAFDLFNQMARQDAGLGAEVLQSLLQDPLLAHNNTKYLLRNFDHLAELLTPENQALCEVVSAHLVTIGVFLKAGDKTSEQILRMLPLANGPFDLLVGCSLYGAELQKQYDRTVFEELLEVASDKHLAEMIERSMAKSVRGYTYEFLDFACKAYLYRLPLKKFPAVFIHAGNNTEASYDHRLDAMTRALAAAPASVPKKKLQRFVDLMWSVAKKFGDQEAEQFNRFERCGIASELFAYTPSRQEQMLGRDLGL